jgi:hypothetical protein
MSTPVLNESHRHPGRSEGRRYRSFARRVLSLLPTSALVISCALLSATHRAGAQAIPTATGPGSFLSVGVAASGFQQDYGQHYIGGETVYVDANLYRDIGIEGEARLLNAHTSEDVKQSTYLVGPRLSLHVFGLNPYIKVLAGRGSMVFPFHYATGSYFTYAYGGGIDWRVRESRLVVRAVDFEYQTWPQFSYGTLHPYGISVGVSYDVFHPSGRFRGKHF